MADNNLGYTINYEVTAVTYAGFGEFSVHEETVKPRELLGLIAELMEDRSLHQLVVHWKKLPETPESVPTPSQLQG